MQKETIIIHPEKLFPHHPDLLRTERLDAARFQVGAGLKVQPEGSFDDNEKRFRVVIGRHPVE